MKGEKTYLITINGLVQGVGFRPFVYQLANRFEIKGKVSNGTNGVEIWFNANENIAQRFYDQLISEPPKLAQITSSLLQQIDYQFFKNFIITESSVTGNVSLLLTPDFAMCDDCRSELNDPKNRRYRYPFITCTHCGPRYSIIKKLPYDRSQITMNEFVMCETCETEYNNPNDRRFYSQTNSCGNCGPTLNWYKSNIDVAEKLSGVQNTEWILCRIRETLEHGKIIAIKAIGGYLLICDATNEATIKILRERKHRPTKPFAVIYPNLELVKKDAFVSQKEEENLKSVVASIVLVRSKKENSLSSNIAPNLNHIGVMLPYSPLLEIIVNDFGKPLVATSGNISGNPIIYEDEKALIEFSQIADYILINNRQIVIPQDDSIVRFTEKYQQRIIIRKSRGMMLNISKVKNCKYGSVDNGGKVGNDKIITNNQDNYELFIKTYLSFGASLKSTFSLQTIDNVYVSQYLGDLESYETQQNFEKVLSYFTKMFNFSFTNFKLFCDAHDGYFSTQLALELGQKYNIQVQKIQHHEAHLAAVLAENGVGDVSENILGVIWDGTGYGNDGNIWGGEFLRIKDRFHFEYFDFILGDKMPREPRISALCLTHNLVGFEEITKSKFNEIEWKLYHKILTQNTLKTSSVGRIFDGVASLLGLSEKQTFEGEVAMRLEELAGQYFRENGYEMTENYLPKSFKNVPTQQIVSGILMDIKMGNSKEYIAAKFHFSLVKSVEIIANNLQIKKLAFSGGVFQNAVLIDLFIHYLSKDFQLFFHKELSPNDENISFGQMILGVQSNF